MLCCKIVVQRAHHVKHCITSTLPGYLTPPHSQGAGLSWYLMLFLVPTHPPWPLHGHDAWKVKSHIKAWPGRIAVVLWCDGAWALLLSLGDSAQSDKDEEEQVVMLLLQPMCWLVQPTPAQSQMLKRYSTTGALCLHEMTLGTALWASGTSARTEPFPLPSSCTVLCLNGRIKPQVICLYPFEQSLLEQVALTQGALQD